MEPKLFDLILTIRRRCMATEERITRELDITMAEFNALLAIDPKERILGHDFSTKMGLSPSRGSRVIDRMNRQGFLHVQDVPSDRRCSQVRLSSKGLRLKRKIEQRLHECEKRILSNLSARQEKQLVGNLQILVEAMASGPVMAEAR